MHPDHNEQNKVFGGNMSRVGVGLTPLVASITSVAALAVAMVPSEAGAENGKLEQIVVTAQKRSEKLQKVPIVVTAVSGLQLKRAGVVDVKQLSSVVSGLSIGIAAGNFSPTIRGVGTTAYGIGIESPVSLYVDGVYYGAQETGIIDLFDIAQVTVLKGPQGTLFGRNATGGVIQLSTRDPQTKFSGEVRTELDNYLTSRTNAYMTGSLSDTVKANLSVGYTTQGYGWGTNIFDNKDNHKIYYDGSARSKVVYAPNDDTSIKLNLDYTDRSDSLNANLVPAPFTTPRAPGFRLTSNPFNSDNSLNTIEHLQNGGFSLNIDENLGFARLVSISAYRQYSYRAQFDPSIGPHPELYQFDFFEGNQATEELQLISRPDPVFNWVAGGYYFYAGDSEPLVDGHYFGVNAAPFTTERIAETASGTTGSAAVFGQATIQVLPATRFTAGLRYTDERRTINGHLFGSLNGLLGNPADNVDVSTAFTPLDANKSFHKLTWRFALDHNFTPDILGYLSYNRGFKSGGFNGFDPSTLNPAYNPETVDAYEGGVKTEFLDHRVRVNASGFYYDYSNIQVLQFIAVPFLYNAAAAKNYGADFDAEASITDDIRLTGGLEYLHAQFTGNSTGTVTSYRPGGSGMTASTTGSITGHQLPFAPEITFNVGANYSRAFSWGKLDYNINNAFSSRYYLSEDNFQHQKAYSYLNTSLTWTSTKGDMSVSLWGRNLFDATVASFLTSAALGYTADYANPPRTFGFTLTKRFGG